MYHRWRIREFIQHEWAGPSRVPTYTQRHNLHRDVRPFRYVNKVSQLVGHDAWLADRLVKHSFADQGIEPHGVTTADDLSTANTNHHSQFNLVFWQPGFLGYRPGVVAGLKQTRHDHGGPFNDC